MGINGLEYNVNNHSMVYSFSIAAITQYHKLSGLEGFLGGSVVKNPPANNEARVGSLGQEDPGEGNGNPLQYSCLDNPMDRGARRATVSGVTKSQTRLSN